MDDFLKFLRQKGLELYRNDKQGTLLVSAPDHEPFRAFVTVPRWERQLNDPISRDPIIIILFFLEDIDVGPHATLEVTGAGLVCNTLRVHITGKILYKGVGPGKIEMNHYERYPIPIWLGTAPPPQVTGKA
jgi:hypothetical protein